MKFLRLPPVLVQRGRSRASHYADIGLGLFTKPVRIGARAVAWPDHEVETLIAAQVAGKSDTEIQELVKSLEAARKEAA